MLRLGVIMCRAIPAGSAKLARGAWRTEIGYAKRMKVEGPRQPRPVTGSTQRTGAPSSASGDFARVLAGNPVETPAAAPVRAPAPVEALFAVQAVEDATERSRRARRRANDLLDRLQLLHRGLIDGRLSPADVLDLIRLVETERDQVDDPALAALLDEIDLRAQVELAKLEVAVIERDGLDPSA
jgi:hypothetical protein